MSRTDAGGDIAATIYRYSRAMDTRNWQLMDEVFTADAIVDMGDLICSGRSEVVRFIRAAIECCEQTHHMNSNIEAVVTGETAQVVSRFSAWHVGKNASRDTIFQALGTYTDDFVCTPAGWRIRHRDESTRMEVWIDGSRRGDLSQFFAAAFVMTPSSG